MTITSSSVASGFDWNIVVAIVAVLGFIGSIIFNVITCRQNKAVTEQNNAIQEQNEEIQRHNKQIQDKQVKIALFEHRYKLFMRIDNIFLKRNFIPKSKENHSEFFSILTELPLLFNIVLVENITRLIGEMCEYSLKDEAPLPDYTDKVDIKDLDYKEAIRRYALNCLSDIRTHMMLSYSSDVDKLIKSK